MMHPVNTVPLRPRSKSRDGIQSRLEDLNLQPKPKVVSAVAASELEDGDTIFIEHHHHHEVGEGMRRKESFRSSKERSVSFASSHQDSCDENSASGNEEDNVEQGDDDSASTVSCWQKALRLVCANRIGFFIMFAAPVALYLGVVYSPDQFAYLTWESFVTVELTIIAMILMINDQPSDLVRSLVFEIIICSVQTLAS
jgi:hypothetical protein